VTASKALEPAVQLLIIDPQNDFCHPDGALFVPGAPDDTARVAALLEALGPEITDVHVTLDSHHVVDISHPAWWVDPEGAPPPPFTRLRPEDVEAGRWTPRDPAARVRSLAYLRSLEAGGRYPQVIWPEHCLVGSWGHAVADPLEPALRAWARAGHRRPRFWAKGLSPWTEHFSAVRAEVPDPEDPHTQPNEALLDALSAGGDVLVLGQALSHCVANTVRDLIGARPALAGRLRLVEDGCSPVPGFGEEAAAFLAWLDAAGVARGPARGWLGA
jgi:nicotinamidase-related amidase